MSGLFSLSDKERIILESLIHVSSDTKQLQRAQALLWLDDGETVEDVAHLLRTSRQTIYSWMARFRQADDLDLAQRLADAPRSGRPPTAAGIIDPLIDKVIDSDPRDYGYHSTVWTAALLRLYLAEAHQLDVSLRSISYAIERLDIIWKRPRHDLARQSATWRQAKGGLNTGFSRIRGRSS
jgi:transposase